jgi:hypothetical protein
MRGLNRVLLVFLVATVALGGIFLIGSCYGTDAKADVCPCILVAKDKTPPPAPSVDTTIPPACSEVTIPSACAPVDATCNSPEKEKAAKRPLLKCAKAVMKLPLKVGQRALRLTGRVAIKAARVVSLRR